MTGNNMIHVPLPSDAEATTEDLELFETVFETIVNLRFQGGRQWEKVAAALDENGWTVRTRLMWVAEATRGWTSEQAVGRTKDEAFAGLQQLTRVDEVAGVP